MPLWLAIILVVGVIIAFAVWALDEGLSNYKGTKQKW